MTISQIKQNLGQKDKDSSLSVTLASDQGTLEVNNIDGEELQPLGL